jgi:hypothetical protein
MYCSFHGKFIVSAIVTILIIASCNTSGEVLIFSQSGTKTYRSPKEDQPKNRILQTTHFGFHLFVIKLPCHRKKK